MSPAALGRLMRLAEARRARDLARLEALRAEDRRLAEEIAGLAATGARDLAAGVEVPLAQQALRLTWAEQRIAAALRRRAAIAGEIALARAAAAESLGKHEALARLLAGAERAMERLREARAEREAPPAKGGVVPRGLGG